MDETLSCTYHNKVIESRNDFPSIVMEVKCLLLSLSVIKFVVKLYSV